MFRCKDVFSQLQCRSQKIDIPNAFQWAGQSPKLHVPMGHLDPSNTGYSDSQSAPDGIYIVTQPFLHSSPVSKIHTQTYEPTTLLSL